MNFGEVYRHRFNTVEIDAKKRLWKILVDNFLQRYIPTDATVVDIGAGYCEFINSIHCKQKIVVDINPDVKNYASPDVTILIRDAISMPEISDESIDVVFVSNFFEHITSKENLFSVIREIRRILKPGGRVLVIQPNVKYCREYWDFIDHYIPLTEKSLAELFVTDKFSIVKCYPRFLPFTTKTQTFKRIFLLKAYLHLPLLWRILGKQCFLIAEKKV